MFYDFRQTCRDMNGCRWVCMGFYGCGGAWGHRGEQENKVNGGKIGKPGCFFNLDFGQKIDHFWRVENRCESDLKHNK